MACGKAAAKSSKTCIINQGFVISNDGIHFREPAHEFVFLKVGPDGTWDEGGSMQGQGFENVGDKTYIYYGSGDLRTWSGLQERPSLPAAASASPTLPTRPLRRSLACSTPAKVLRSSSPSPAPGQAEERSQAPLRRTPTASAPKASLKVELLTHDEKPLPRLLGADGRRRHPKRFPDPGHVERQGSDHRPAREVSASRPPSKARRRKTSRFYAFYLQKPAPTIAAQP